MPRYSGSMAKQLTPKERIFVKEWMVDKNGARSATAAGYAKNSARQTATKLLTKAHIKAEIDKEMAKQVARIEIHATRVRKTKDEWLERVEDIAFSDMTALFTKDANGKISMSMNDIKDRKVGHLIKKIKVHRDGKIEVDLKNDQHALELLAKHNGWIADQINLGLGESQNLSEQDFKNVFDDPKVAKLALQLADATCKPVKKEDKT